MDKVYVLKDREEQGIMFMAKVFDEEKLRKDMNLGEKTVDELFDDMGKMALELKSLSFDVSQDSISNFEEFSKGEGIRQVPDLPGGISMFMDLERIVKRMELAFERNEI